jgi:hypothetical protein
MFDVHVVASHVVNPGGRSYFAAAPEGGARMVALLAGKVEGVRRFERFQGVLTDEAAIVEETSAAMPKFVGRVPDFEIVKGEGGRCMFRVKDENPGLHKSAVIVRCPGRRKCVTQVDGFQRITSFVIRDERRYVIRQSPAFLQHQFAFNISGEVPVPVDVAFSYHELSEELKQWLMKFPPYVAPFAKVEAICDTVLVTNLVL